LGLCAQYNAIWDKLTVDEHLECIGQIKGLDAAALAAQSEYVKKTLELQPFSNVRAENLSGGNKRKLCCAISLLANPLVEFMDEPTTGVDPIARRSLFNTLRTLEEGSIVLTTHRMDEAEQLCDKIAIMINGRFVCFGSPGYLKSKYGQGYTVTVKLANVRNQVEFQQASLLVNPIITGRLPFCVQNGQANDNWEIDYQINDPEFKLSEVFRVFNELKNSQRIADFSVGRSSLEHVFIHFARYQHGPREW